MSERKGVLFLYDILECIVKIERYIGGLSFEEFQQDDKTLDAVLRNRLIHGYFAVDEEIVWDIVTNELPALRTQIEHILQGMEP